MNDLEFKMAFHPHKAQDDEAPSKPTPQEVEDRLDTYLATLAKGEQAGGLVLDFVQERGTYYFGESFYLHQEQNKSEYKGVEVCTFRSKVDGMLHISFRHLDVAISFPCHEVGEVVTTGDEIFYRPYYNRIGLITSEQKMDACVSQLHAKILAENAILASLSDDVEVARDKLKQLITDVMIACGRESQTHSAILCAHKIAKLRNNLADDSRQRYSVIQSDNNAILYNGDGSFWIEQKVLAAFHYLQSHMGLDEIAPRLESLLTAIFSFNFGEDKYFVNALNKWAGLPLFDEQAHRLEVEQKKREKELADERKALLNFISYVTRFRTVDRMLREKNDLAFILYKASQGHFKFIDNTGRTSDMLKQLKVWQIRKLLDKHGLLENC